METYLYKGRISKEGEGGGGKREGGGGGGGGDSSTIFVNNPEQVLKINNFFRGNK